MYIYDDNGNKTTPNRVAKEKLADAIITQVEYFDKDSLDNNFSSEAKDKIQLQLMKRANGALKHLGYQPYFEIPGAAKEETEASEEAQEFEPVEEDQYIRAQEETETVESTSALDDLGATDSVDSA